MRIQKIQNKLSVNFLFHLALFCSFSCLFVIRWVDVYFIQYGVNFYDLLISFFILFFFTFYLSVNSINLVLSFLSNHYFSRFILAFKKIFPFDRRLYLISMCLIFFGVERYYFADWCTLELKVLILVLSFIRLLSLIFYSFFRLILSNNFLEFEKSVYAFQQTIDKKSPGLEAAPEIAQKALSRTTEALSHLRRSVSSGGGGSSGSGGNRVSLNDGFTAAAAGTVAAAYLGVDEKEKATRSAEAVRNQADEDIRRGEEYLKHLSPSVLNPENTDKSPKVVQIMREQRISEQQELEAQHVRENWEIANKGNQVVQEIRELSPLKVGVETVLHGLGAREINSAQKKAGDYEFQRSELKEKHIQEREILRQKQSVHQNDASTQFPEINETPENTTVLESSGVSFPKISSILEFFTF